MQFDRLQCDPFIRQVWQTTLSIETLDKRWLGVVAVCWVSIDQKGLIYGGPGLVM